jgi:transglutaminase-like putative cysteine protease
MNDDLAACLSPGRCIDSDHPAVTAFAHEVAAATLPAREIALRLYAAVRDRFPYDPYRIDTTLAGFKASTVIENGRGFCVTKAALLAAAARALGVPARLGFADVRNHLSSPRLREMMGSDLFVFHGYTELWLDGRWVKATPAFNRSLCEKGGILPLSFDGYNDSVFHPFDASGRRHMEYVHDRGSFVDVPHEQLMAAWMQHYPAVVDRRRGFDRHADFEREVGGRAA